MDPAYIAAIQANAKAPAVTQGRARFVNGKYVLDEPQAKQQKKKGRGGFLSSLISEASGAGGAGIGAAIGSLAGPLGTVVGAGLGGLIGGTGGRGVENKVRDDQNFFGAGGSAKAAWGEGALSGLLSGAGAGFQAVKGAKAAKGLSGALGAGDDIVVKAAPRVGGIEGAGRGIKASAMGYGQGARLGGERIGAGASDEIGATLKALKIKSGSPEAVQRALENRLSSLDDILTSQYSKGKVVIPKAEMKGLQQTIEKRIADEVGTGEKFAQNRLSAMTQKKDTSELWDYVKNLKRNHTNFGANPSAKLADREAVARIISDEVKNFQNVKLPGVAKTNALYHQARNADDLLKVAAADIKGGGLVGKISTLSPVRAAESKIGNTVEKVGQYTAGTAGPVSQVTRQAKIQAPGNLLRAMSGGVQEVQPQQEAGQGYGSEAAAYAQDPTNPAFLGVDPAQFGYPEDTTAQASQQPYGLQDALAEAQQLLGPDETPASYLSYAKALMTANKPDKVAIKAQDAQASGSQALSIVNSLEQTFQQAGGGQGRVGGTLSSLAGKAGLNSNVQVYNDARTGFLSNVARSLGEKGVLTDVDIERIARLFPQPSSNPQEAAAKWAQIRSIISGGIQKAQSAYGAPSQGSDLSSSIQQGGY